mmetsp:Transcript_22018/g.46339  ORF Transcript_22018/g.46339 Transcript_22018/m.46339 type:complete len:362 (-) Transcript_22018:104-1189(-)|eukprot:CAMPEP_0171345080 /NCGR_PEP_ID=MMETSP0878-20121228/20854_1 /TAXON_ID=67004 /ORGANISM="Thalassiosira weissflogii, Strain CCMP1336" /LENGTH=361 /DNA_ID=CAMNT_0011848419 /DNA_START=168 /DNA_END=1253 /DNA_ORIENTATION=+
MMSLQFKPEQNSQDDDIVDCAVAKMDPRDVRESISVMFQQEEHYLCDDYLRESERQLNCLNPPSAGTQHHPDRSEQGEPVDALCRAKICEWIFQVVDFTKLQRETVSIAMSYLDRFLCSSSPRAQRALNDRKEYQLAALTTLYIAVKLFEPLAMDAELVSKLSRGLHTPDEITEFEYDILCALKWRVQGPTTFQFVNYIMELLPVSAESMKPTLFDFSHFQVEIATGDYAFVPLRRSTIAIAAVLNALEGIPPSDLPFGERISFIRSIGTVIDFDIFSPEINAVRMRLLDSFAQCSGYELSQVAGLTPIIRKARSTSRCNSLDSNISNECFRDDKNCEYESSPICVSREMVTSLGISENRS